MIETPYRNPALGKSLKIIGFLMIVLGAAGIPVFGSALDGLGWIVAIVIMMLGVAIYLYASRLGSVSAGDLLAKDKRAPIVFVRSFQDEQDDYSLTGYNKSLKSMDTDALSNNNVWGPGFQLQFNTLLESIGPYIAIGRPGENLAGIGAARVYVSDDDWQDKILEYFHRSQMVIMRAGKTQGLHWELEQLVEMQKPQNILLILPHTQADYQEFRQWANDVLPKPLPADKPDARFLLFRQDWTPQPLTPQRFLFNTLEPFFKQNQIERKDIRLSYFLKYDSWLNYLVGISVLIAAGLGLYFIAQLF